MGYRSVTEGGYGIGASTDHVDASQADRIDIPDPELLFRGHFARSGPDLVLTGQDGHRLVVTGYFATEKHPDLVAPNGAHLNGELVDLLAGSPTPGQYAQARTTLLPDAIGKVEKVVGQVTLIHNGVAGPLHVGDPVYKTDIVQTGANSTCGIAFPDGTALDLVNNTRMALNEYNYEANSASNGALFSLVEGTFAFVAGQVAHTGEGMKINTPIATMGIRGTVGLFRSERTVVSANLGNVWSVFLHEDIDGSHHLGRIALIDQDPTSPTFGQVFYQLDSSEYIAYLEPQGAGQPPHVRLEPNTNAKAFEDRHFFDDLGKILDSYNNANPQSPPNPGSGDNPGDLFPQQLFQEDGGKPLFNFGKLNGSGDPYNLPSSSPLIPVMGGLIPNTDTPTFTGPTLNGPTTNFFIWTGGTGPWTLGPNWTPGTSPGSPNDIVEIPSGTVIYNNNFMIGTLIVGPNGTVDIVGGSLTVVNEVSNSGTIIVEGDPPALTINGPVTVGNIGSFTATGSGDEIQFANGTVDNHGAISALDQGTVSFVNEGMTNDADGKILARGKGSEIDFANAILTNIGIIAATHHGEVRLTDVTLQNGINGVIAADDGGKIWITDLQHGSTNYGLVEAFDGGKITIVGYNNNGGGSGGSGHNGNLGNIDAIGCSSSVDIESHNGGSFDNQNGGTVAALEGGKVLFSGDVTNHEGGAIEAAGCETRIEFSNGNLGNSGDITAKHDGVITLDSEIVTNEAGATVVADDAFIKFAGGGLRTIA